MESSSPPRWPSRFDTVLSILELRSMLKESPGRSCGRVPLDSEERKDQRLPSELVEQFDEVLSKLDESLVGSD